MEEHDGKLTEQGAHIMALNNINEDVPKMLAAAGKAIKLLTSSPMPESEESASQDDMKRRKAGFRANAREYVTLLQSINDRLQTEVQALEDAGLLPKEDKKQIDKNNVLTHGGLGSFDVAWLNARTKDVGAQKEAELFKEARLILERIRGGDGDADMTDVKE